MRKMTKVMGAVIAALLVFTACSTEGNNAEDVSDTDPDSEKTQVMTSIYPVYEITKEIAGDRADVSLMVGENEDAHHYEPSAQAVASVNEADVFIYSSDQMEFWAESLLNVVENEDLQVIELAEGLDLDIGEADEHDHDHEQEEADGHDHDHGGLDPHFWLDPVAVKEQLPFIVEALSQKDPENESYYVENQNDFADELDRLDEAYQEAFADAENREFVVQHQAFGHLANRYHLDQVAVGGLTTEVEPDPQQLSRIINFINEEEVPVVYYQSGENSAIAETIAQETGTEIGVLYDLENKPSDDDLAEDSYTEMMQQNLEELQKSIH